MFLTTAKLTDTRFLKEKHLMAVAAKGFLKKAAPGTGAGSCLFEDHCGTPVWGQLYYGKEESDSFNPARKIRQSQCHRYVQKTFLEWTFLLNQKKRVDASRDLGTFHRVGGIRHQLNCLSLWETKSSAPSRHTLIDRTWVIDSFLSFHSYKNTLSFPW